MSGEAWDPIEPDGASPAAAQNKKKRLRSGAPTWAPGDWAGAAQNPAAARPLLRLRFVLCAFVCVALYYPVFTHCVVSINS